MKKYLEALIEEKGIEGMPIEFENENGMNYMDLGVVVEFILNLPKTIQQKVRKQLVMIDFKNGDVMDFFIYMAKGMATV